MTKKSNRLPSELLQAFAETHYIVHHETPFAMHIGQPCPDLKALMAKHNALSAAFITAWNPFSQNLYAKENQARQDELKANLKRRGLICITALASTPATTGRARSACWCWVWIWKRPSHWPGITSNTRLCGLRAMACQSWCSLKPIKSNAQPQPLNQRSSKGPQVFLARVVPALLYHCDGYP